MNFPSYFLSFTFLSNLYNPKGKQPLRQKTINPRIDENAFIEFDESNNVICNVEAIINSKYETNQILNNPDHSKSLTNFWPNERSFVGKNLA